MILLGITGTNGAGKGAVVEFFKNKGFTHYSAREFIKNEVTRRGLAVNRYSLTVVGNNLRINNSASYIMESLYKISLEGNENCIFDSVRIIKEVEFLRKIPNFYLIAVDADINLRYERIIKRKSETDAVSFDEFKRQEEIVESSNNPNEPNLRECIKLADKVFYNNSSIEILYEDCNEWIKGIIE